jgi:diguanylate cyclase
VALVQSTGNWRNVFARNERIAVQALLENLRRLWWLACLLVPLSLVHVMVSWVDAPHHIARSMGQTAAPDGRLDAQADGSALATATAQALAVTRWKEAVVVVHLGMAANLLVLSALIWWARRQSPHMRPFQGVLEAWGLISALGFTIIVASIDQWISAGITPFLIGCVLVGALFLLRPQRAALLYGCAFVAYAWTMGLTQGDDTRLLSNRVDGLIAAVLGFMVSLMIWRKHVLKETLVSELQVTRMTLQERNIEVQSLAVRDTLTGLWNRAEIMRLAQRELTRAQRHGGETCFIMVDLDSFKLINDRWGHGTGDRVLAAVANLLLEELRATDEVGRLAGEEFAVLLPQTTLEEARLLAERLHSAVSRLRVPLGDAAVRLTASIGAASQTGRALVPVPQQVERLFNSAEQALASAKSQGRDRVVVAPPMASLV